MMKNMILAILGILIVGQLCRFGLPWWGVAPVAAVAAWIFPQSGFASFLSGLIAGALLWGSAAYMLDHANASELSAKTGQIFQGLSSMQLVGITALLGGLLGGLGALTGQLAREMFSKPKKDYYPKRRKRGRYRY